MQEKSEITISKDGFSIKFGIDAKVFFSEELAGIMEEIRYVSGLGVDAEGKFEGRTFILEGSGINIRKVF